MKTIKMVLTVAAILVSSQLSATENKSIDLDHYLAEKKAITEENLSLTEQEKTSILAIV